MGATYAVTGVATGIGAELARMLRDEKQYFYLCGLKGMESGVLDALRSACESQGLDWTQLESELRSQRRLHVEVY